MSTPEQRDPKDNTAQHCVCPPQTTTAKEELHAAVLLPSQPPTQGTGTTPNSLRTAAALQKKKPLKEKGRGAHPVKHECKVHMYTVAGGGIQQDIFSMPVPQPHNVAHHGPHRGASGEDQAGSVPGGGLRESGQEPAVQHGGVQPQHLVQQLAPALALQEKPAERGDVWPWFSLQLCSRY